MMTPDQKFFPSEPSLELTRQLPIMIKFFSSQISSKILSTLTYNFHQNNSLSIAYSRMDHPKPQKLIAMEIVLIGYYYRLILPSKTSDLINVVIYSSSEIIVLLILIKSLLIKLRQSCNLIMIFMT